MRLTGARRSRSGRIWEWFWRTRALAAARSRTSAGSLLSQRLQRAQLATELGDRALDPIDPLRAGSSIPLALSLYREAAYWGLLAQLENTDIATLREAFAAAPQPWLVAAAGDENRLEAARAALVDKSFVQSADDPSEVVRRDAELARELVHSLIDSEIDRDRAGHFLIQRWLRVGLTLLLLALVGTASALTLEKRYHPTLPDLAAGKSWRTSSKEMDCKPKEHRCGGTHSDILFHTTEEKDPWFELDLGLPRQFARVEVVNRHDCCPDRAIPLVIEVSQDQKNWRQVARRNATFKEWDAELKPVTARYVRLRVDHRSTLHLERVSVRAK